MRTRDPGSKCPCAPAYTEVTNTGTSSGSRSVAAGRQNETLSRDIGLDGLLGDAWSMGAASHLGIDLREYDTRIRSFIPGYEDMLDAAAAALAASVRRRRPVVVDLGHRDGRACGALPGRQTIGASRRRRRGRGDARGGAAATRSALHRASRQFRTRRDLRSVTPSRRRSRCTTCRRPRAGCGCFRRLHRALRPGGVLIVADCYLASNPRIRAADRAALARAPRAPLQRARVRADTCAPGRRKITTRARRRSRMIERAGFAVDIVWRRGSLPSSSPKVRRATASHEVTSHEARACLCDLRGFVTFVLTVGPCGSSDRTEVGSPRRIPRCAAPLSLLFACAVSRPGDPRPAETVARRSQDHARIDRLQVDVDLRRRREVHEGGGRGVAARLLHDLRHDDRGAGDADGGRRHRAEGRERGGGEGDRQAARAHPGQRPRRRGRGQGSPRWSCCASSRWGSTRTGCSRWCSSSRRIYNADGNEKFALTNRQRQNGPINGMGTRANAQNLNINRDYMKLDTPEAKAFVKLWNDYDPQVGFDLHTSDGSAHGYYLTYSPPLNPDTSPTIMKIMTDEWFPFVTKNMKAKHGWDSFYYGNVSTPAAAAAAAAAAARRAPAPRHPAPPPCRAAAAGRPARVAHVRARAALPQQLRRPAQPLRAAQRGLRLRDLRGSDQGDQLLHGGGARTSRTRTPRG